MDTKSNNAKLPEYAVQLLAAFSFFAMLGLDKVAGLVQPPLDDVWYAIAAGVAVFGSGLSKVVDKFRK